MSKIIKCKICGCNTFGESNICSVCKLRGKTWKSRRLRFRETVMRFWQSSESMKKVGRQIWGFYKYYVELLIKFAGVAALGYAVGLINDVLAKILVSFLIGMVLIDFFWQSLGADLGKIKEQMRKDWGRLQRIGAKLQRIGAKIRGQGNFGRSGSIQIHAADLIYRSGLEQRTGFAGIVIPRSKRSDGEEVKR